MDECESVFRETSLTRSLTAWCAVFLAWAWPSHSWADDFDAAESTRSIISTVTRKMGDVGGKFFGTIPDPVRSHHYYIVVELAHWDYAPTGLDPICGKPFPPSVLKNR